MAVFRNVVKKSIFRPDNFLYVCRDNFGQVSARYLKKPRRRYSKHESVVIRIYRSKNANMTKKGQNFGQSQTFCQQTQEQHETHQCAKFQGYRVTRIGFMAYLGPFQAIFDPRKWSFQPIFGGRFLRYLEKYLEFLHFLKTTRISEKFSIQ